MVPFQSAVFLALQGLWVLTSVLVCWFNFQLLGFVWDVTSEFPLLETSKIQENNIFNGSLN